MNNPAPQQNTRTPAPAAATSAGGKKPATAAKERINIHRFNISGYIAIDSKKTSTVVEASDAVNAALKVLTDAKAVIQKDEAYFTSTTLGSEDADEE